MVADPGDRQVGDDLVALGQLVEAAAVLGGRDDVVVGQHHALRPAGRARGVEDDREVRALAWRRARGRGAPRLPRPASRRFRPSSITSVDARAAGRGRNRAGRAPRRRGCASSVGTRSAMESSLSTCSWSCTTAMRDLGMREHVGHLVGDRVGVDRHRHGAEPLRRRHRPIEPRPVVADDRDLVAAPEPELLRARPRRRARSRAPRPRSRTARCRDPCGGTPSAPAADVRCAPAASERCRRVPAVAVVTF